MAVRLLRRVEHILTELEEAELELKNMAEGACGDIYLCSCAIFNAPPDPQSATSFFLAHPQIGLHMYVTNSNQIEELLRRRKIDFGFTHHAARQTFPVRRCSLIGWGL